MAGALCDQRLGVKGDAQTRDGEHGQIVGAVADSNRLLQRDVFLRGDLLQELGLALGIDDLAPSRGR